MSSWSSKRRFSYGSLVALFVVVIIGVPAFFILYNPPTCTDRIMNGSESGVDCGGSCVRLCQSAFLPAKISWVKYENVAGNLYNLAAYIVNPNTEGTALGVEYKFSLFDKEGVLITEVIGDTVLPPHRNTLAFDGAISMGQRTPARITFEFTKPPLWFASNDTLAGLTIGEKKYIEDSKTSSLEVTLGNTTLYAYKNISIHAVLYDADKNVIGFSKTFIDKIMPESSEIAPFTWPITHNGGVTSIEVLPVVVPPGTI